jgi:hypothetical protein
VCGFPPGKARKNKDWSAFGERMFVEGALVDPAASVGAVGSAGRWGRVLF